jgi:hypothetical protein
MLRSALSQSRQLLRRGGAVTYPHFSIAGVALRHIPSLRTSTSSPPSAAATPFAAARPFTGATWRGNKKGGNDKKGGSSNNNNSTQQKKSGGGTCNKKRNFYDILGVERDCDAKVLRAAYLRMARDNHPDVGGGDAALFRDVTSAYNVLKDPMERMMYDGKLDGDDDEAFDASAYTSHVSC